MPVHSVMSVCGCVAAVPGVGTEDGGVDTGGTDPAHGCCSPREAGQTAPKEHPSERQPCPDDECPRACCAAVKVLATPDAGDGSGHVGSEAGAALNRFISFRSSPHLRALKRPPRPVTPA
jgi:hypothetical protein